MLEDHNMCAKPKKADSDMEPTRFYRRWMDNGMASVNRHRSGQRVGQTAIILSALILILVVLQFVEIKRMVKSAQSIQNSNYYSKDGSTASTLESSIPKIAFMFLWQGRHHRTVGAWENFFKDADPRCYNIYVHTDRESRIHVESSRFRKGIIDDLVSTDSGGMGRVSATVNLIKTALRDPDVQALTLLGDVSVPLHSFEKTYADLIRRKSSSFVYKTPFKVEKHNNLTVNGQLWSPIRLATSVLRHEQFFSVTREHAELIINKFHMYLGGWIGLNTPQETIIGSLLTTELRFRTQEKQVENLVEIEQPAWLPLDIADQMRLRRRPYTWTRNSVHCQVTRLRTNRPEKLSDLAVSILRQQTRCLFNVNPISRRKSSNHAKLENAVATVKETPLRPKLAFLFLMVGEHKRFRIWENFFANADTSRYVIKVHPHPDHVKEITSPIFRSNVIEDLIPTFWGSKSLVDATMNLMKAALEDPEIGAMTLLSDSCVPLRTFNETYTELTRVSKFTLIAKENGINHGYWVKKDRLLSLRRRMKISVLSEARELDGNTLLKHQQFFSITRPHAELVMKHFDRYIAMLNGLFGLDEVLFATILAAELRPKDADKNEDYGIEFGRYTDLPDVAAKALGIPPSKRNIWYEKSVNCQVKIFNTKHPIEIDNVGIDIFRNNTSCVFVRKVKREADVIAQVD